jgi:uncharacterized protein (DUF2344 family)
VPPFPIINRSFILVHILAQLEKPTQICGVVVIYDFEGLGMKQVTNITPSATKRLLTFIQKAMPIRLKEVHIVKQPFIFNMIFAMMKPLLDKKMSSRVRREVFLCYKCCNYFFLSCISMVTTCRSCTSSCQQSTCQVTMVESYPKSATLQRTGIRAQRSTMTFSKSTRLLDSSNKCLEN